MNGEPTASERNGVADLVLTHVEVLEAMAEHWNQQAGETNAEARAALGPLVEQARALQSSYAAFREQFYTLLDRVATLDLDALQNFHGFGELHALNQEARKIKRDIAAALEDFGAMLAEADAFIRGEQPGFRLWDFRWMTDRYTEGLRQLFADIRHLGSRMRRFKVQQPNPESRDAVPPSERFMV